MRQYLYIFGLLVFMPGLSWAADYTQLQAALKDHPDYVATRQMAESLGYQSKGALGLPDPRVSFAIDNYPTSGGGFGQEDMTGKTLGISQEIPNPKGLKASAAEFEVMQQKARLEGQMVLQSLQARLDSVLAQWRNTEHHLQILAKQKELLEQEAAYWDGRLGAGENVFFKRSEVDANLAAITAQEAMVQANIPEFQAAIMELTQIKIDAPVNSPVLGQPLWQEGDTAQLLPVQLAQLDISAAQSRVDQRDADFSPNFMVGMNYMQRDDGNGMDRDDLVSAMVGVSIPLWASKNQTPKLEAAKTDLSRATSQRSSVERQWNAKLVALNSRIQQVDKTIAALQTQHEAVQQKTDALARAYESGDAMLDAVLFAQMAATEIDMKISELQAEKVKMIAEFNSVFGDL